MVRVWVKLCVIKLYLLGFESEGVGVLQEKRVFTFRKGQSAGRKDMKDLVSRL